MTKRGDRSTIAAYIERFRGPATSRQERARSRDASKRAFWWIADEKETEEHGVDAIDDAASPTRAIETDDHLVEEEEPAKEDARQEHSVILSEPPSPPASPAASDKTLSSKSLDRGEHEDKAPYDEQEEKTSYGEQEEKASYGEQEEKASYGERDPWASLSPLSSPKHDDSMSLSSRHYDLEAISVDSSLTDTVGPQWYVRPEEVLIEDPEVTIQRLRQRLGLSGFAPARPQVEWNAPLTFPDWSQAVDDYMHLDDTETPVFPSPSSFQVVAPFAYEMPHVATSTIDVDVREYPEQPTPATVIAPSSPLGLSPFVPPLGSPHHLDPPTPTSESVEVAPEVNEQVEPEVIEVDQQVAPDASSIAPAVSPQELPTISPALPTESPALPPRPPRRGIAFGKVLAPPVQESTLQVDTSQLDPIAQETTVRDETAPAMLASIMDDLVTSVVTSWVEPAPAPPSACALREAPALPEEPPALPKEPPALSIELPLPHEAPPKTEALAMREDDVRQTETICDDDPMDSITEFLDDDIVRALVHRVLVCEEALAIVRARAVMAAQRHASMEDRER